jgi:hypothetical protein
MSCTYQRTCVLVFLGVLAACGDDGARQLSDASDPSQEAPSSEEEEAGSEAGDRGPGDGSEPGDDAAAAEDEDAGGSSGSETDAGAQDARAAAVEAPEVDLGSDCHDFDFDGPQNLIVPRMMNVHWPAPSGGSIVPGTYDLVSEERFVAADASEAQADVCDDYEGAYWERLVLTDSEWSRLNRNEDHTVGRQIFRYSVADGKVERTQTCPKPAANLPAHEPRSYSAAGNQLLLFDDLHEDGKPPYCEYLFTYVRKP